MDDSLPRRVQGVYAILNTQNLRIYVGSSVDMAQRWTEHQRKLLIGAHHNSELQSDWRKYGPQAFRADVLEVVTDYTQLAQREVAWIKRYGQRLYNVSYTANSRTKYPSRGLFQQIAPRRHAYQPLTDEQRADVREYLAQGYTNKAIYRIYGGTTQRRLEEIKAIREEYERPA